MKEHKCEDCKKEFNSKEALEMHNKSKHKETYKEPWLTSQRKNKIKKYAIWLTVLLLITALGYWFFVPPKNAPIIEISPSTYNFGRVSQTEGQVSTTMTITNRGKNNLVITNMDSSCGCTSASIIKDGSEGPRFSMAMHGTNPKEYSLVIPAGESAKLKIYYDPNVHKDLRGDVTRSVFIMSNDPRNPKKEIRITVNQVA